MFEEIIKIELQHRGYETGLRLKMANVLEIIGKIHNDNLRDSEKAVRYFLQAVTIRENLSGLEKEEF